MHYLQNSWFIQNGMWVFVFALAGAAVISYMNNRKAFMKKSVFALCFVFLLAFGYSILMKKRASALSNETLSLVTNENQNRKVESGSLWGNFVNYVAHVIADRVKE